MVEERREAGARERPGSRWPAAAASGFNLIPVIDVLFWRWSAFALIFLYRRENVAIGGRTLLSMLACGLSRGPISITAAFASAASSPSTMACSASCAGCSWSACSGRGADAFG